VACRVILRGRVGVENGELKVGVHGAHLNEESIDAAHPAWYCQSKRGVGTVAYQPATACSLMLDLRYCAPR
jgi:hypothetical protein